MCKSKKSDKTGYDDLIQIYIPKIQKETRYSRALI